MALGDPNKNALRAEFVVANSQEASKTTSTAI
jgi:hypothetical protein